MTDTRGLLLTQLEVAWALLDYHLTPLTEEDLHWVPASVHWTVRRHGGEWRPDFADVEPDPVPVPTAAWLTWHIGWWWGTALSHLRGQQPRPREDVLWPGDADLTRELISGLHQDWRESLSATDALAEPTHFPWPVEAGHTKADMAAWVNVELTKNASELGQLRLLRAARAL